MIEKSEGIVLKKVLYGESGIIATVLTPDQGPVALLAKGARRPKSTFAGLLEPGNLLHLVYYRKSGRSVQTLREASFSEHLFHLRTRLESITLVSVAMELLSQIIHEGDPAEELFHVAKRFLIWLEGWMKQNTEVAISDGTVQLLIGFAVFQLRIADTLGFGVQVDEDLNGAKDQQDRALHHPLTFEIETGRLTFQTANSKGATLSEKQALLIREAVVTRSSRIFNIALTVNEAMDLIHRLDRYLAFHIEGLMPRRSDRIFEEVFIGMAPPQGH